MKRHEQIFVSYSREDRRWFDELQTMLRPLVREHDLQVWDDAKISPGVDWRQELQRAIARARVAVLLVSEHFLASDFIARNELLPLLAAAEKEHLKIFWIYVSPCLYQVTEINRYQAAHDRAKPLREMTKAERLKVLRHICAAIGDAALTLTVQPQEEPLSQIEVRFRDSFYHIGSRHAAAIRLVGAGDESFPPECVHLEMVNTPYVLPRELQHRREKILRRLTREAREQGSLFFDGPCVRLIDYRASPVDSSEQKHLELQLGPMTWYDYSVANQELGQNGAEVLQFVDLNEVAHDGIIRNVQLTNILTTYATVTTNDGHLLYSRRSGRVASHRRLLISAISENIHPVKDGVVTSGAVDEVPAPFRTVHRGLKEELSPDIAAAVPLEAITLLGLCFHFQAFHPGLLFLVTLPLSLDEVLRCCREHPGVDFMEGQLCSTLASREGADAVLADPGWFPAGKACLIRCLEFLEATTPRRSGGAS